MSLLQNILRVLHRPAFFIFLSFGVWLYCLKGFFLGQLSLSSDAVSYYEHIRFFLTNLMSGDFALWDPYWSGGVPNDFFLRRICPYNPFYLVIIILHSTGVPFYFAYLAFLAFYVFFGLAGFFLLCRRLTNDNAAAFVAFAVLLFSALTTRIFDSYMMFIVTPLVWFFYFLVQFGTSPSRLRLAGLTFFSMILMTTYLPFFFAVRKSPRDVVVKETSRTSFRIE